MRRIVFIYLLFFYFIVDVLIGCEKIFVEIPLYKKLSGGWELKKIEIDGVDSTFYINVDSLNMVSVLYFNPNGSVPQSSDDNNGISSATWGLVNTIDKKGDKVRQWFYDYKKFSKNTFKIYMIGSSIYGQSDSIIQIKETQLYGTGKMRKIGGVNNFLYPWKILALNSEILIIELNYNSKNIKKYFTKRMI